MFDELQGQSAIITGSTSGIGLALAERLAAHGVNIMLNGFGDAFEIEANRNAMADRNGVTVRYHGADMSRPDQIRALIDETASAFGSIDILINNAGIQKVAAIDEFPDDKWDAIMAINLSSAFHTIKHSVPHMKKKGRGRIINVASAHGLTASPFKSAYVAAKHGIVGLTKVVGLELAEQNITCNAVCPGYVLTPLVEGQVTDTAKARGISEEEVKKNVMLDRQPTKEFVTYDQLAGMVLYLVSDLGAGCTATAYSVDGGWTAM